jgi:V/A-type H+-transporting ATPase subunit C
MSSLLKYSAIATKIRAMKGRLLTDREYQEIAELKSIPEVASYLKTKPGYAKLLQNVKEGELHRGELEEIISSATYNDFDALYYFANQSQRRFLQIYAERFEIRLLKSCMTDIFSKGEVSDENFIYQGFFDKHTTIDLEKLRHTKDMQEFILGLEDTIYHRPLKNIFDSQRNGLQDYELALDFFHFVRIWKNKRSFLSKKDCELLEKEYGSKFDMLNIHWIFRAKHYYKMEGAEVYAIVIPLNYKLKKDEIKQLVESENREEFDRILKKTHYGRRFEELNTDTIEEMYRYILKHTLETDAKKYPYSMSIIYSYLYHKEHEIGRLIVDIESIRYQVDTKTTMEHIRKA